MAGGFEELVEAGGWIRHEVIVVRIATRANCMNLRKRLGAIEAPRWVLLAVTDGKAEALPYLFYAGSARRQCKDKWVG